MSTFFGIVFWVVVFLMWREGKKIEDAKRYTQAEVDAQWRKVQRLEDKKLGMHPNAYIHKAYEAEAKLWLHMVDRVEGCDE